jgi:hypothetical protein
MNLDDYPSLMSALGLCAEPLCSQALVDLRRLVRDAEARAIRVYREELQKAARERYG